MPETSVYAPWALVRHDGELCLAYIVKYFGGGPVFSPFNGGRGHLVNDLGEFRGDSREPIVFKAVDFVYEWRTKPSLANLDKARARDSLIAA